MHRMPGNNGTAYNTSIQIPTVFVKIESLFEDACDITYQFFYRF